MCYQVDRAIKGKADDTLRTEVTDMTSRSPVSSGHTRELV